MSTQKANDAAYEDILRRDGTSQANRKQVALDPDYVSVDERSFQDLLAFAQAYAKELRYFDVDVKDGQLRANGDWSAFLEPEIDLEKLLAYVENPEDALAGEKHPYGRPHFALFLTFLKLLRHAQDQFDELTRRHLDFYYQDVLRMCKLPGTPDRIHVLGELASGVDQMLLPAGSLLDAGSDSQGQALVYSTDQDLVLNQAQVARLSTVFVDKRVTGVREARENWSGPKSEAIMEMLQISLGKPSPGDALPTYPQGETEIDYDFLVALQGLLDFTHRELGMNFADLRGLMKLKGSWENSDGEWQEINDLLQEAGRRKRGDDLEKQIDNVRDFKKNLKNIMGGALDFDGLTEVDDLYDVYEQRTRNSVQQFIRGESSFEEKGLHFENIGDFVRMMQIKIRLENEWAEINRILQEAGRKKRNNPDFQLDSQPLHEENAFTKNLKASLEPDPYYGSLPDEFKTVEDLDQYYAVLEQLEIFFYMLAEDFSALMSMAQVWIGDDPDPAKYQWDQIYTILEKAYRDKLFASFSKDKLREIREYRGFEGLINYLVGDAQLPDPDDPLTLIQVYIKDSDDFALLEQIKNTDEGDVSAEQWEKVYTILELAQRVRLADSVPQKEEWFNLYPLADATKAIVQVGTGSDSDYRRWKTFGRVPEISDQEEMPPLDLGWAISSPMLSLSQGVRTIALTLGFQREPFDTDDAISELLQDGANPFQIEVSTKKGWIRPEVQPIQTGDYQDLRDQSPTESRSFAGIMFKLVVAGDIDPLAPLPETAGQMNTPWPALRLRLRQQWQDGENVTCPYQPFKNLELCRVGIDVQVSGLLPAQLQNDETSLDPKRPFEPFGSSPAAGSRFFLGHPELVTKSVDRLVFRYQWMGLPEDGLGTHYRNYSDKAQDDFNEKKFTTHVILVDNRVEKSLSEQAHLFTGDGDGSYQIQIPDPTKNKEALYERMDGAIIDDNLLGWNRFLLWELNVPDFQHSAYPTLAVSKSVELASAFLEKPINFDVKTYQVNPPYTPVVKGLKLDYDASQEILVETYRPGVDIDQLFHIHPFGYSEFQATGTDAWPPFLPQYDHEGELYIGIREAHPPQNLSLLFQMAEGSADPDLEPFPVTWSYLDGNNWISLEEGNVLHDATRGLINSGVILLDLPPVEPNSLLDPDLYWIRAAIPRHSNSVCDTVAIHTQAIPATFVDRDNVPDHLNRPLPVDSIADLTHTLPGFAGFRQPYTSFGGKMAEEDSSFYTRISERLRHKERALSIWDYEHLILERFTQLYKVKCLPADQERPGQIEIIVIPDIRDLQPSDPFQPKASVNLLADIKAYLEDKIPPFATISVKNAHYVPVKVRFGVRFRPGFTEGYYRQQLNDEINRFLSPWAYDEEAEIVIGGRIYANTLVNFIEEREYVDYVATMKLFKSEDGRSFRLVLPSAVDGYWVGADHPDGVLVAARRHEIDVIPEEGYEPEKFSGINYMKIELDFIVA